MYIIKRQNTDNVVKNLGSYIKKLESYTIDLEIDNSNIYKIHKAPKTLEFILKNEDIQDTLYNLRPLLVYDKNSYLLLVVYLEYFLKFHYNVLLENDKYDNKEYLSIMKDIRREILNISKSFVFNAPDISLISSVDTNLKEIIEKSHIFLKSFTYKYLMILKHKFDNLGQDDIYQPPYTINTSDVHMMY
jgi:hypothetical protein